MCRALAYAHDLTADDGEPLGMIHRDVSPSNVMLSYEGAVKLLDFGIAKALGGEKEESGTQRGTLKGKFAYMAPEQTQGNDVDRRIDIFATGIVLHEILTGRRLFKGENDLQTVERVRQCEVAPPSLQNPLCPPELDAIVLRALARNRDERFQSSSEMADALDDVVHAARFQPDAPGVADARAVPQRGRRAGPHHPDDVGHPFTPDQHRGCVRRRFPPVSGLRPGAPSRPSLPRMEPVPTPPPRRSFLARGSTWGALALGVIGVGVGVFITRNTNPPAIQGGATTERDPLPRKFNIAVRSIPDGASIYLVGENRFLGTTDTYLPFEISDDKRVSLVFKKEGYQDETREVSPYPMLVQLKALPEDDDRRARKGGRQERPSSPDPEPTQLPTITPQGAPPKTPPASGSTANPPAPAPQVTPAARHAPADARQRGGSAAKAPPAACSPAPTTCVSPF